MLDDMPDGKTCEDVQKIEGKWAEFRWNLGGGDTFWGRLFGTFQTFSGGRGLYIHPPRGGSVPGRRGGVYSWYSDSSLG